MTTETEVRLLELPDDDPVLGEMDPNASRTREHDHDLVYATRWNLDKDHPKMVWGHKPQHRPQANAPYTRVYCKIRKCRICGVESKNVPFADCSEWRGECNGCGDEIPPDEANFGKCDDCRPDLPTAPVSVTNKVFYRRRRENYLRAKGEL